MAVYTQRDMEQLVRDLQSGKRTPVYLFFGDGFLVKEAVTAVVDELTGDTKKAFSLQIVDGDRERVADTIESLNTFSLFEAAKVVWTQNSRAFYSQKTAKDLLEKARRSYLDGDRPDAAKNLSRVLGALGWEPSDIVSGRLRSMDDKEWLETFGSEKNSDDVKWLEEIAVFMREQGTPAAPGGEGDLLEQALEQGFAGDNLLILSCLAVDKRRTLFKLIQKIGAVVDLSLAEGSAKKARDERQGVITEHVRKALKEAGKTIDPGALSLFYLRVGDDLQTVYSELDKLISYTGTRAAIERADVEEVVSLNREDAVFEIMDAVGERDAARALALLRRLQEQSVHLLAIHSVLIRKIRQLLWAKGLLLRKGEKRINPDMSFAIFQKSQYNRIDPDEQAIVGKMAPYAAFKLFQQARRFSLTELSGAMDALLEADIKLKSGALEPQRIVEELLIKVCLGEQEVREPRSGRGPGRHGLVSPPLQR